MTRTGTVLLAALAVLALGVTARFLNANAQERFLLSLGAAQRQAAEEATRVLEARQGRLSVLYDVRVLSVDGTGRCTDGSAARVVAAQQFLLGVTPAGPPLRVACGEVTVRQD